MMGPPHHDILQAGQALQKTDLFSFSNPNWSGAYCLALRMGMKPVTTRYQLPAASEKNWAAPDSPGDHKTSLFCESQLQHVFDRGPQ